jgi:hypothetical protein
VSQLETVEDNLRSALLTVQLDVTVQEKQKVSIALNEWTTDSPATYMFDRPSLSQSSNIIEIPINNVKVGEYLLRINIDGAESKLGIDDNPDSPTFNWYNSPKIRLS